MIAEEKFIGNSAVASVLLRAKTIAVLRTQDPDIEPYWLLWVSVPVLRLKNETTTLDITGLIKCEIKLLKDQVAIKFFIKPEDLSPVFEDMGISPDSIRQFNTIFTANNRKAIIWYEAEGYQPRALTFEWEVRENV